MSHTRIALLAATATLLAGGSVALADDGPGTGPRVRVVLRAPGGQSAAAQSVRAAGGRVLSRMQVVGAVSAEVPVRSLEALRAQYDVQVITPRKPVEVPVADALGGLDWSQTPELTDAAIGSDELAARGLDGSGVDVAVLDTGTADVPGLAGRVVHGPDLSLDSQDPALRQQDAYGHGTHMASLIAGSSPDFHGVAPGARIVSVKVGAADGAVDVTQVLAGIDWVVQHKDDGDLHIRVLNISFGTDSVQATDVDPLAYAAEVAWQHGIVVVASVGNDGRANRTVADPASSPDVIAVGAADLRGSADPDDAVPASFSSRGTAARHADLLAPGVHVLGLRDPGSWVDTAFPEARRGEDLTRGSGSSQATALVSGSVALLLQARPDLTPDQVKALLVKTAHRLSGPTQVQGSGLLDIAAAVAAKTPKKTQTPAALTGTGSVEAARGGTHVASDGVVLTGEQDVFGAPLDTASWAPLSAAGTSWSGGTWNGNSWSGNSWSGNSWSGNSWSGNSWSGNSWSGNSWSGNSWSGNSWSGNSWSGNSWSGNSWSGNSWSGNSWSGNSWSAAAWLGHSWS